MKKSEKILFDIARGMVRADKGTGKAFNILQI